MQSPKDKLNLVPLGLPESIYDVRPNLRANSGEQTAFLASDPLLVLQKSPLPELIECLLKLFLRVHHNRAVPRDRLLERLT